MAEELVAEGYLDHAVALLERCVDLGFVHDTSLSLFFKACFENGHSEQLFTTAIHWITTGQREFRGHSANSAAYYAFLCKDVDFGITLVKHLHHYGVQLRGDYPYSITIHSCNSQQRWNEAVDIYTLFQKSKLVPGSILLRSEPLIYALLTLQPRNILHTARGGKRCELFQDVVDDMLRKKYKVNYDVISSVMETCKLFGDLKRARAAFTGSLRQPVDLSIRYFNNLLSIYKDAREMPPLEDCFQLLERLGMRPDAFTFGNLLGSAYITEQSVEVIDRILKEAESWGIKFNSVIVTSACVAYHRAATDPLDLRIDRALELLSATENLDQCCFHVVLTMCVDLGQLEKAFEVQQLMEQHGYPSNEYTYRLLIQTCLEMRLDQKAKLLENKRAALVRLKMTPSDL